jgi:hypothetical protein
VVADPEKVRLSQKDKDVYLFHRREGDRWLCTVAKREEEWGFPDHGLSNGHDKGGG